MDELRADQCSYRRGRQAHARVVGSLSSRPGTDLPDEQQSQVKGVVDGLVR